MIDHRKRLRQASLVVLTLYWGLLFYGTHRPLRHVTTEARYNDKLAHFGGYAGLTFLMSLAAASSGLQSSRTTLAVILIAAAYGAADECSQMLVSGRSADFVDWFADCGGAVTGILLFQWCALAWSRILSRPEQD